MNECIIGVGSNIEPRKNIALMLTLLQEKVHLDSVSDWVKTAPIGITDQPDFVNGAVRIRTPMNWLQLNNTLKLLEDKMGRDRSAPKYGSRVIDLDIIVWNGLVVDDDYYHRTFLRNCVDQLR